MKVAAFNRRGLKNFWDIRRLRFLRVHSLGFLLPGSFVGSKMRFGTFVFLFFYLLSTLAGPKAVYGEVPLPVTASTNDTDPIGSLLGSSLP